MYLLLPLESFTSLLNIRDISKRKRWRSRPLRIRVFGSQTWNDSWRMSSPWDSMFSSNPGEEKRARRQHSYLNTNRGILTNHWTPLVTFQHGEVHCIIGFLGNAEHHLQAVLDFPLSFFAAGQQLLKQTNPEKPWQKWRPHSGQRSNESRVGISPWAVADTWWFSAQVWSDRRR